MTTRTTTTRTTTTQLCPYCSYDTVQMIGDDQYRQGTCDYCDESLVWSERVCGYVKIAPGMPDMLIVFCRDCGEKTTVPADAHTKSSAWLCDLCHDDYIRDMDRYYY